MRTWARLTAVVAATALLVTAGTASADDRSGHAEGHGRILTNSFDFHVRRDSDGHVHGYFKAVATAPFGILIAPEGPVTCAEFDGNKVGFLYPLRDETRPFFAKGQYIMIVAEENVHGPDKVGFLGPAPRAAFPGCNPDFPPAMPIQPVISGHIDVDSGNG
jgi:hypothetical protein